MNTAANDWRSIAGAFGTVAAVVDVVGVAPAPAPAAPGPWHTGVVAAGPAGSAGSCWPVAPTTVVWAVDSPLSAGPTTGAGSVVSVGHWMLPPLSVDGGLLGSVGDVSNGVVSGGAA